PRPAGLPRRVDPCPEARRAEAVARIPGDALRAVQEGGLRLRPGALRGRARSYGLRSASLRLARLLALCVGKPRRSGRPRLLLVTGEGPMRVVLPPWKGVRGVPRRQSR